MTKILNEGLDTYQTNGMYQNNGIKIQGIEKLNTKNANNEQDLLHLTINKNLSKFQY